MTLAGSMRIRRIVVSTSALTTLGAGGVILASPGTAGALYCQATPEQIMDGHDCPPLVGHLPPSQTWNPYGAPG